MSQLPVKLLLVEDNPGDVRFLQEILKESPDVEFEFHHADRLDSALQLLAGDSFDIILLDLSLPDGSGLDTVVRTREAAAHVPIVVLTGLNDEALALNSVREGAQDYLVKGQIEIDVLVRAIRYAIERHRLQVEHEKQKRQIEELAAFVQLNPNPVLEFARDGRLIYSNEAAVRVADSLGLEGPGKMIPSEKSAIVTETLATGEARQGVEIEMAGRILSWSFFPIPKLGVVHSYAVDITEKISLEVRLRHSQKMEAVGQLAAGVAHDFNNYLTLIQGHLGIIECQQPPENLRQSLQQARLAVDSASNLTRQLLMFSRPQEINPRSLDLNEVIGRLADLVRRPLGREIELKIFPGENLSPIRGDAGMIEQIILNLAVNARDAMPAGGTLTIATEEFFASPEKSSEGHAGLAGRHVFIRVSDTGDGMSPETAARIFEPFFSTKAEDKGTGLGLATVYGLVNQHKGWIDVDSKLSEGTTFTVYFPAEESSRVSVATVTGDV